MIGKYVQCGVKRLKVMMNAVGTALGNLVSSVKTPTDTESVDTGIAAHLHVEAGIADHHGLTGVSTGFAHGVQHHAWMRLAGSAINCLQCIEIAVQVMMFEDNVEAAPRLAGRHAHQPALIDKTFDGIADALIEGFGKTRLGPLFNKSFLVECRKPDRLFGGIIRRCQMRHGFGQLEPDDHAGAIILDPAKPRPAKSRVHGFLDHLPTVDNRAVNVPDSEFQGGAHAARLLLRGRDISGCAGLGKHGPPHATHASPANWSAPPMTDPENITETERTALDAAAFRRLLAHLDANKDVQNIDLMLLADFCRNCLGDWWREAAAERGIEVTRDQARERVYGMPPGEWKAQYQGEASPEKIAAFKAKQAAKGMT